MEKELTFANERRSFGMAFPFPFPFPFELDVDVEMDAMMSGSEQCLHQSRERLAISVREPLFLDFFGRAGACLSKVKICCMCE